VAHELHEAGPPELEAHVALRGVDGEPLRLGAQSARDRQSDASDGARDAQSEASSPSAHG
jgi:hypothetical protein